MTKDAYYFSHDATARNDFKILKVRRVLGLEGYAIYFCLIEMLREQADYRLPITSIEDIAHHLNTSEEKIRGVIHNFDLFKIEENYFFSDRLLKSMDTYNELKNKLSEAGRKGGLSRAKALPEPPSSIKGKERKGNKRKTGDFSGEKNNTKTHQDFTDPLFGKNAGNQNFDPPKKGMVY